MMLLIDEGPQGERRTHIFDLGVDFDVWVHTGHEILY